MRLYCHQPARRLGGYATLTAISSRVRPIVPR